MVWWGHAFMSWCGRYELWSAAPDGPRLGAQEDESEEYHPGGGDEAGGVPGVAGEDAEGGGAYAESGVEGEIPHGADRCVLSGSGVVEHGGAGGSLGGAEADAEQYGGKPEDRGA